jgi:hypothetical protein
MMLEVTGTLVPLYTFHDFMKRGMLLCQWRSIVFLVSYCQVRCHCIVSNLIRSTPFPLFPPPILDSFCGPMLKISIPSWSFEISLFRGVLAKGWCWRTIGKHPCDKTGIFRLIPFLGNSCLCHSPLKMKFPIFLGKTGSIRVFFMSAPSKRFIYHAEIPWTLWWWDLRWL